MKQPSEAIEQAKHLVEQHRLAEAISYFESLVARPEEEKAARIWLARLALMSDAFTSAESQLKIVLDADPVNAEALALQGICYIRQGQLKKAGRALETAREHEPQLAMVYPNLAFVYRELHCLPESMKAAAQGIRLQPGDPQGHLEVARTLWAMKQPQQAISHAVRSLELDPLYLFAYRDLGRWLVLQGRQENAIDLYLEGVRHRPDAWYLREQLVGLYLPAKQSGEAAAHARFLAEHRGTSSDYVLLGDCLAVAGDTEGAESAYEQAIKVAPESPEARLRLAEQSRSANRVLEEEGEYHSAAAEAS